MWLKCIWSKAEATAAASLARSHAQTNPDPTTRAGGLGGGYPRAAGTGAAPGGLVTGGAWFTRRALCRPIVQIFGDSLAPVEQLQPGPRAGQEAAGSPLAAGGCGQVGTTGGACLTAGGGGDERRPDEHGDGA